MVTSHRAAALAMRLDVHLEFDSRFPAVERLEVCGWPPRCEPPGSTRSSAHQAQGARAHLYHTKTPELSGSDPTFDPASVINLLSDRRPSKSPDHRGGSEEGRNEVVRTS